MPIFRKGRKGSAPKPEVVGRFDPTDMLEADRATLAALVDAGADLANERNVRHYLYGGERNSVEGAAATLRGLGYNVEVADAATGSGFVAIAERRQVVNLESATEARDVFERLAADIPDGEYDGWEAELVEA